MTAHAERKHSRFSASGAERWINCPGSVRLSEGLASKDSAASIEGTLAHEALEDTLRYCTEDGMNVTEVPENFRLGSSYPFEMRAHTRRSANFLLNLKRKNPLAEFKVETRIHLPFVHEDMFGTYDSAVVDHFGTLHIYDFKYGKHLVQVKENLQLIIYAVGTAWKFDWNFKKIRLLVDQPRARGYDGPSFWEAPISEFRKYVPRLKRGVDAAEKKNAKLEEGEWCFFCPAKKKCPKKLEARDTKALAAFDPV